MKIFSFPILLGLLAFGLSARGDALNDEIKSFADALKSTDAAKQSADPLMAERMSAIPDQLEASEANPGGDAQLEEIVRQLMATNHSASVQKAGKALLDDLAARKKAKADALKAEVDAVFARAPDILTHAEKTEELDGLLSDLQKMQPSNGAYDPDAQAQMNRVNQAYQFVAQWQDYLSARNSGNIQDAQTTLRNLANSGRQGDFTLVPRSVILERAVELATATKPSAPNAPAPAPPAIDEGAILAGIKTLDDMEPALKALKATSNNQDGDAQSLGQLVELYANARNGLPVILDFGSQNYGNISSGPEIDRLKAMLLVYLLPGYLGNEVAAPNPNETVRDYLNRVILAAEGRQDWVSLEKIISAEIKIMKAQSYPPGTRSFMAGLNQEMAGQFALAVTSYQNALREPDDYLPAPVVGDRLAAIKKDHPAEFAEGMKTVLNPPAPSYPYAMRAAMMGYPMPGGAYPPVAPGAPSAPIAVPSPAPSATSTNRASAVPPASANK